MKSLIKPVGLVILFGLLMLFGAELLFTQETKPIRPTRPPRFQDTTKTPEPVQKETYVSEVILRAPWATRSLVYDGEESPPGKFGLNVYEVPDSLKEELPAPPLPEGPTSFTVAPNGDIYITDPLNERIQRFDANGNFVSVIHIPPLEKDNSVPELSDSARAENLRRAGKLLEDGTVPPKPKATNWYQYVWSLICADRHNNIYLLWWGDYTKQTLCKYDQEGKLLAAYPFFPEVRFGGGGKLYCDDSGRLFFEYTRKESDKIILSLKEELLLKKPYAGYTFQIGTTDQVFTAEEQEATLRKEVRKIPNWSEIKKLRDLRPPGEGLELSHTWNRDFVDEKGNFYHYWPTKEGITITKWYKQ
jgi:hypothetical protein